MPVRSSSQPTAAIGTSSACSFTFSRCAFLSSALVGSWPLAPAPLRAGFVPGRAGLVRRPGQLHVVGLRG